MRHVPGGRFWMGADDFYPEERPVREAQVGAFWMDEHPVTNAEFAAFVDATGYETVAERMPSAADFPDAAPHLLVPGSLVFQQPRGPVDLRAYWLWWRYVPGADWRHPEGPDSSSDERRDHPVVHVALQDVRAFAAWAGKSLPTEAEWEFAARSGLDRAPYAWGAELAPGGRHLANTWQGSFPWLNTGADGYERTSPVGSFPANGYGLVDLIGNVWEWTADPFDGAPASAQPCCGGAAPAPGMVVIKGGSFLCAPDYCARYRPAARSPQDPGTSACHVGFRCVVREPGPAPA